MLTDALITEVIRGLQVTVPTGDGQKLAREAMASEAARTGLSTDMIARAWKVGLSIDKAIELVRAKQAT